ncbi:MAG: protein kinase [Planctomycetales bacterium]|nr:protein kinase [Planctomycetales bacterium]
MITEDPNDERIAQACDEFLAELEAGKSPCYETYLEKYSQIAHQLRPHLEGIAYVVNATNRLKSGSDPQHSSLITKFTANQLGGYQLGEVIGRGGMGIVYQAESTMTGETVAIKVLSGPFDWNPTRQQRFRNEALIAERLIHSNIVPVYSSGEQHGIHYLVMKLVRGRSLTQQLSWWRQVSDQQDHLNSIASVPPEPIRLRQVADWTRQIAFALHYAHQSGVLHRDIKPSNILVNDAGHAYLTDFGLAQLDDMQLTSTGDVLGTWRYMSPEQALGRRAEMGPQSDIYSLGATLFELCTLCPMFAGEDRGEVLQQIITGTARHPRGLNPIIPRELETIILKATYAEPSNRYESAEALGKDLGRFLDGKPVVASRTSAADWFVTYVKRHRQFALLAMFSSLLLACVFSVSFLLIWRAQQKTKFALTQAQQQTSQAQQLLYLADMQQAFDAWNSERTDKVQKILDRHEPRPGQTDRREFSWFLLDALAEPASCVTLGRHAGAANEVAILPNSDCAVSVGDHGHVMRWNLQNHQQESVHQVVSSPLFALDISPDGKSILFGGAVVQLWDLVAMQWKRDFESLDSNAESVAFSPDGSRIVVGFRYDAVQLYDIDGELLRAQPANSRFESLSYTPDGSHLLIPSRTKDPTTRRNHEFVAAWDADIRQLRHQFIHHVDGSDERGKFKHAIASPTGRYICMSGRASDTKGGRTVLFAADDLDQPILELPWRHGEIKCLSISHDERMIAAGFDDGTIDYWLIEFDETRQLTPPSRKFSIDAHEGQVRSLKFTADGRIVSCGQDGFVKLWTLTAKRISRPTSTGVYGLAPTRDDGLLVVRGNSIERIDTHKNRHLTLNSDITHVHDVTLIGDGLAVVTLCSVQSRLELRDANTLEVIRHFELGQDAFGITAATDRSEVAVACRGQVQLLEIVPNWNQRRVLEIPDERKAQGVAYDHAGAQLAIVGDFGEVLLFDPKSGRLLHRMPVVSPGNCVAFCEQSGLLATGHDDGAIRIWDTNSGRLRSSLTEYDGQIRSLAFSPDGRTLASVSSGGVARLWSVPAMRELGVAHRSDSAGWKICFSANGQTLYIGYHRELVTLHAGEPDLR